MDCPKPVFSTSDTSVVSTVRELHYYFRNLQAYYKVLKGRVISKLEYNEDPEIVSDLNFQLCEIERKLKYIHILNNSASTVNEVVHLIEIKDEFRLSQETIKIKF
ncbi:hypothetical protein IQ255_22250 [Pleurocapsales cyanobacterium LEGE 10410]|nr:hypothetical protein [Pleurocapsales cyanobacterium LEGE 10410]